MKTWLSNKTEYSLIIVWADFCASGLWVPSDDCPKVLLSIAPERINAPKVIINSLNNWVAYYDCLIDRPEEFDYDYFNEWGVAITNALRTHFGNVVEGAPRFLFLPQRRYTVEETKEHFGYNMIYGEKDE
jgi:hypothetical protein